MLLIISLSQSINVKASLVCLKHLGPLDFLHAILRPLVDGMLALAARCGEVGEPFLESQIENLDVNIVAQLLTHDEKEVAEDESSE